MEDSDAPQVHVSQLRIGMFVQLDLGWMEHPFPIGSFKISSIQQIESIRALGLNSVRYLPDQSDVSPWPVSKSQPATIVASEPPATARVEQRRTEVRAGERLLCQRRSLLACEHRHDAAMHGYLRIVELLDTDASLARAEAINLVAGCVSELLEGGESSIRLLAPPQCADTAFHAVNVMMFSLLLGKASGMLSRELVDLGTAALLHDLGADSGLAAGARTVAPGEARRRRASTSPLHVANGVAAAQRMGLTPEAVRAIAEHHETVDGSGFPAELRGDEMSIGGKILSLVNRWDDLCNPVGVEPGLTPHSTLSALFGQQRSQFDPATLGAFVRMMGLYPPGSLVQLADDRHALVTAVNSSRPLRPQVIVHDAAVPREEALLLELEQVPDLAIRRALRADQLPPPALEYLRPPTLYRYFFERALSEI